MRSVNLKPMFRLIALVLVLPMLVCLSSCEKNNNPVVMSTDDVEITIYDFRQAFYGSQYFQYYYYGMMSAEDYTNAIIDEMKAFMYIYNAALDAGTELTAEEETAFDDEFNAQLETVLSQYESSVDSSITDPEEKRVAAIELLEADLEADGLTYDEFLEYSRNNLYMYKLADAYYTDLRNQVVITDDDVQAYVDEQLGLAGELTMEEFRDLHEGYMYGSGPSPVYVPEDCFSVNHILLLFETSTDDSGAVTYLTDSRNADSVELESKFASTADFDAFMELEAEYGDDPGMDEDVYVENGYIIHDSYEETYYDGFVYAAMNLYFGEWTPEPKEDSDEPYLPPELEYFTLADSTPIVKVATESGIHYIIVNQEYHRGEVSYEIGDARWESWRAYIGDEDFNRMYDSLYEEWQTFYTVDVDTEFIMNEFLSDESEAVE